MYKIDLGLLLTQAFGVGLSRIRRYGRLGEAGNGMQRVGTNLFVDVPEAQVTEGNVTSSMGVPILMPVKFLGSRYKTLGQGGQPVFVEYPDWQMPPATLVEVTRSKIIQRTRIAGRNGTVKEYIGEDDWQVTFKGLIVNPDSMDAPPETGIRAFREMTGVPDAIGVEADIFEWLGIDSLVVTRRSPLIQLEGFSNVVGYSFEAFSDEPVEVRLRDGL